MWIFSRVGEDIEQLAKQIEETPELWVQGDYWFRVKDNPTIGFWTANGSYGFRLYGDDSSNLNWAEKRRLRKAIHICKRKQIALAAKHKNNNDGDV